MPIPDLPKSNYIDVNNRFQKGYGGRTLSNNSDPFKKSGGACLQEIDRPTDRPPMGPRPSAPDPGHGPWAPVWGGGAQVPGPQPMN